MSPRSLLFALLIAVIASSSSMPYRPARLTHSDSGNGNDPESLAAATVPSASLVAKVRTKRGIFWDFFSKIVTTKNLVVDQFVDTKNTLNEVYNLVNEGFSDPGKPKPTITSSRSTTEATTSDESDSSTEENMTTTTPYSISRYELGRILGRNFRGLQRLTKIEFQDAFNQSRYNIQEYKDEANKQFANSLAVEKKKHLKRLKG